MNPTTLEFEIAEATKHFLSQEWRLDIATFKTTNNRAWVHLAGRILSKPGAVMPVKSANRYSAPK